MNNKITTDCKFIEHDVQTHVPRLPTICNWVCSVYEWVSELNFLIKFIY